MMKTNLITTCSFVLVFFGAVAPILAIDSPVSVTPGARRQVVQQIKQTIKTERTATQAQIQTQKAQLKTQLEASRAAQKQKTISISISKIRAEIVARYTRLLADKTYLQARIAERKAKGLDTTAAETKLATFSTASYTSHLATFDSQTVLAVGSTRPYLQSPELKASVKSLNTDLLDLRKILTQTISSLVARKTTAPTTTLTK